MAILVGRRPCTESEAVRRGFGGRESARRRQVLAETLGVFSAGQTTRPFPPAGARESRALGCGAFRNPADEVAAIYREEIEQRRDAFSIIAFAIRQMPYQASNFIPFQRVFAGL